MTRVHAELAAPGTCGAGYNTLRFDDEMTRYSLYRNFFDPYAREWQGGNSRWDLIDVVCEITGKTVERPELTPFGEEAEAADMMAAEEYRVPVAGAPGALNYTCVKCGNKDYEVLDMSSTSGMLSRMVNLQNRRFSVVACRRCKYCELYKTESGMLRNAFDLLIGS